MKSKRKNIICGFIAVLSFIIMAVAFYVGNLDIVVAASIVFFVASLILGNRMFRNLDGADSGFFDDFGYL